MEISLVKKTSGFLALFEKYKTAMLLWENPISAAVLAILIFFGFACLGLRPPWVSTSVAYFNYLADAFMHGQLYLRIIPENHLDLSFFQGRYYLYWGPLPAILMIPLVAVFGVGFSDILMSVVLGGVIAGLVALLLRLLARRGWVDLSPLQRALVVVFFTLGTALTPLPQLGKVWYVHTLEALAFAILAYVTAFAFEGKRAFFWTGVAMSAVLATRLSVGIIAIFPAWYLLRTHWRLGWRQVVVNCIIGVLPALVTLGLLAAYNAARFGNPLDTGINYHLMGDTFRPLFERYGVLSWHFIPANLYAYYLYIPWLEFFEYGKAHFYGGSVFLMSPLFFAAIYALWAYRKRWDTWVLLASFILGNIPAVMVMGPGSIQYGSRYALDFILPLLLLTALGMKRWPVRWVAVLVGLSILQFLPGIIIARIM